MDIKAVFSTHYVAIHGDYNNDFRRKAWARRLREHHELIVKETDSKRICQL